MKLYLEQNNKKLVPCISQDQNLLSFINFDDEIYGFIYEGYTREILIDKSDKQLYELFFKLYRDLQNCTFYPDIYVENFLKHTNYYKNIIDGETIKWQNQNTNSNKNDYFTIQEKEDGILFTFNSEKDTETNFLAFKIMDINDKNPFNIPFLNLYNSLCKLSYNRLLNDYINKQRTLK